MRFRLILVVLLLLAGALSLVVFLGRVPQAVTLPFVQSPLPAGALLSAPTPTPMPFAEMTIPYLRERTYESSLGERRQVSSHASYTAYTTSYLSDGLRVNGLLTIPAGDQPVSGWPAIVFIHGYIPPAQYRTTEKYVAYVDALARNGFVVFKIDLRGHGQSEGEAGGGYYSSDYVIDALNARAALASSGLVNPAAIGLWGHSMAGNVSMRAFAAQPDIPAVVIWGGAGYTYTDLQEYRISDTSYRAPSQNTERARKRQQLREIHGEFTTESPFWRQVAVTDYLEGLRGAVQLLHAANDDVVSVEYSRNLARLLDATTVPHELYEYSSGGHNIESPAFNSAMQRTVEFFKKYLL